MRARLDEDTKRAARQSIMGHVLEERYLTNRAKVERIKAKVKIRFKPSRVAQAALMISKRVAVILAHLMAFQLIAHLSNFHLNSLNAAPVSGSAPINKLGRLMPTGSSELSFEYLGLRRVPSDELCTLMGEIDLTAKTTSQVNLVSFANNRISQLNSSAFICVGTKLKILNLRNNKIELISEDAFNGLNQLQVLLLDGNQLKVTPAASLNRLTGSLRHLNLANNLIESIEDSPPRLRLANLISLSLKGNPLARLDGGALKHLSGLKTLTLTQVELNKTSAHLGPFEGLHELRHLHLDRLANLTTLEANFCATSRKLASLSLKSNQLALVPQLTDCQALLSIDLSYNQIKGSLEGNFSRLINLIDLYLGHNHLETLDANAFHGLAKLQVLELNANNLKHIHASAFVPLRATLYELNVAHNPRLSHVSHLKGLDRLVSLKSYGNAQLRQLPYLPRAKLLALTYAYHCCDYLRQPAGRRPARLAQSGGLRAWLRNDSGPKDDHGRGGGGGDDDDDDDDGTGEHSPSLTRQLFQLILSKLSRFLAQNQPLEDEDDEEANRNDDSDGLSAPTPLQLDQLHELQTSAGAAATTTTSDDEYREVRGQRRPDSDAADASDDSRVASARNISELVLWWPTASGSRAAASAPPPPPSRAANSITTPSQAGSGPDLAGPEAPALAQRARRWTSAPTRTTTELAVAKFSRIHLIDELIWQVKQIRFSHAVGHEWRAGPPGEFHHLALADDDYATSEHANGARQPAAPTIDDSEQSAASASLLGNLDSFASYSHVVDQVAVQLARDFAPKHFTPRANQANELQVRQSRQRAASANRSKRFTERHQQQQQQRQHEWQVQCLPQPNAFQPCRDLFDSFWLRAGVWLVFPCAFVGNILVVVVLGSVRPSSSASALTSIMWFNAAHSKRHIDVPRFLILNLAIADLLMALYLGLLAFVDLSTLGQFRVYAIKWQHSLGCQLAGFLAVLSSELSVFILAIITLERNYAITNAVHLNRRLSLQKAMFLVLLGYLYALTMAILPLNGINDYRKFSVCLPLDYQPDRPLWASAANLYLVTLVGINSLSFLLLISCYLRMYCAIRGSQAWNSNDLKIAKRMSVLVLTDFMCWSPIILVGSLALMGNYLVGHQGLKWLIIFVLPLNSVANPFLYAITTKKFKRDLRVLKKRLKVDEICALLGLVFALITTCRRPRKRKAPRYEQATVAIRRNRHRQCLTDRKVVTHKHKNGQLEIIVAGADDIQRRRQQGLDSDGRLRADARSRTNQLTRLAAANGEPQTGMGINKKLTHQAGDLCQPPRKGSQLLAKTLRLVRGADFDVNVDFAATRRLDCEHERAGDDDDDDETNQQNAAANTCNQVTMNKTTCFSCQQRLVAVTNHSVGSRSSLNNIEQQQHQHQPAPPPRRNDETSTLASRPRIVLDSIELQPDERLESSVECPCERSAPVNTPCSPGSGYLQQLQLISQPAAGLSQQSDANNNNNGSSCCANAHGGNGSPVSQLSNGPLRPSSSTCHRSEGLSSSQERTPHVSCQTILVNERESRTRIRTLHISHQEKPLAELNNNRSVSACAYNWPTTAAVASAPQCDRGQATASRASNQLAPTHHLMNDQSIESAKACSCSCDAIGRGPKQRPGAADAKRRPAAAGSGPSKQQARSINRLVFGPFAKAWSTLQLSLNSVQRVATPAPTEEQPLNGQGGGGGGCGLGKLSKDQNAADWNSLRARGSSEEEEAESGDDGDGEDEDANDHNDNNNEEEIIDDILQMSSPARRQLHTERRMSRSCDMIMGANHQHHDYQQLEKNSSSVTTNEPSSSFYDQNDDQRILLATINQLTTRRKRRRSRLAPNQKKAQSKLSATIAKSSIQPRRAACTRCRSWSPALLDKLEDCMYQIGSRLPKLGASKPSKHSPVPQPSTNTTDLSGVRADFDSQRGEQHKSISVMKLDEVELEVDSSAGSTQEDELVELRHSSNESNDDDHDDHDDDLEVADHFNEIGFVEWTRNMQKKAPINCYGLSKPGRRHRLLQQQLSGNSDTLSSRTVGTTFTNLSFDSSTSIPAVVAAAAAAGVATGACAEPRDPLATGKETKESHQ